MASARGDIMSMIQTGIEFLEESISNNFTLFEAFGIEFSLHFSAIIIPIYIFFTIGLDWVGFLLVLGVIASVFIHEIDHAVCGFLVDYQATEICLFACGGYTRFSWPLGIEAKDALVSMAGPLTNGLACCLLIWIERAIHGGKFWDGMIQLLSWTFGGDLLTDDLPLPSLLLFDIARLNAYMLLFNLLPAFPLDGGRIITWLMTCFLSAENGAFVIMLLSRTIACLIVIQSIRKDLIGDFNLFNLVYMLFIAICIWCASREEYLSIMNE